MVIRRRKALVGGVALAALVVGAGYLWRFAGNGGLVPFLLAGALLAIAFVHLVALQTSRAPALIADLSEVRVRLGGGWTGVPWAEVASVEVSHRRRLGDGRVVIWARDEERTLAGAGLRARFAVLLNRWLYDAALVVPYGLTATASTPDVLGALARLADDRAPVLLAGQAVAEPDPTVEVAAAGTWTQPAGEASAESGRPAADEPTTGPDGGEGPGAGAAPPRRLAAVVSALRSQAGRLGEATVPIRKPPLVVGTLALAGQVEEETEPLPELEQLRRRAPEIDRAGSEATDLSASEAYRRATADAEAGAESEADRVRTDLVAVARVDTLSRHDDPTTRTTNVELIIDATTDLSAQAMRKVRWPFETAHEDIDVAVDPSDLAGAVDSAAEAVSPEPGAPAAPASPGQLIGAELGRAREWLGLTVDDLADRTRIRPFVIESIEAGDFVACGGDFYARGHLRMLAAVLGIDPGPLVSSYDEHLASAPVSPRAVFDAELSAGLGRNEGRGGSRWGLVVGAVLVLLLVWGVARYFLADPSLGAAANHPPTSSRTGLGSPGAGNTIAPPPAVLPAQVTLSGRASSSRVVVWDASNTLIYQGVLKPGETRTVSGQGPLRVMAVDAGAVAMTAVGHPRAPMGPSGQRVFRHVG